MLHGCYLSYAQGAVDFNAFAPSVDFTIIRGGDGLTWYDEQYRVNRDSAHAHGIPSGYFWIVEDTNGEPLRLGSVIINGLYGAVAGEPIVLDVESHYDRVAQDCYEIALMLTARYGCKPLIYTNRDVLSKSDWSPVVRLDCGLWLADWDGTDAEPTNTAPFEFAAIKQKDADSRAPGVPGPVDNDIFYGDVATFRRYGIVTP